jgi:hypothetical protein
MLLFSLLSMRPALRVGLGGLDTGQPYVLVGWCRAVFRMGLCSTTTLGIELCCAVCRVDSAVVFLVYLTCPSFV